MTDEPTKWTADPKRGAEFVAPKRAELIEALKVAADVAITAIEENEREAIKRIKEEAGQKRAKVNKAIAEIEGMEPMKLIRKFWSVDRASIWGHFLGDQTKVGNIE